MGIVSAIFDLAFDRNDRQIGREGSTASFHCQQRDGIVAVRTRETAGMFALEMFKP
jgi:hypothetical protein